MTNNYTLICGLEVHAELKTSSKMFCGCKNDPFHAPEPNTYTCPVCLGMPGGLPVANKKAIEWTVKLGLALNCKINLFSKFDRKHYFYPDLPKGYQISQYDIPFCHDGFLETSTGKVRIRRIHLEEDTAKLVHGTVEGEKATMIDFNRSSVPLIEIVTEPDLKSPEQAKEYSKKLREIIKYLDISDADMEQGGMRLEANVSMQKDGQTELPNYKVELKNINSFRFLEQAIAFEMKRQVPILDQGEVPAQETRGYDSVKGETFSQRSKEEAEDYRYFPDPDLPPLRFTEAQIESWRSELPELPNVIRARFAEAYTLPEKTIQVLTANREIAEWSEAVFNEAETKGIKALELANAIVNKRIDVNLNSDPKKVVTAFTDATKIESVDEGEVTSAVKKVMSSNPDAVEKFKSGNQQVIGFFMGQVMREIGKKVDAQEVKNILISELEK